MIGLLSDGLVADAPPAQGVFTDLTAHLVEQSELTAQVVEQSALRITVLDCQEE